jgi:hypothetical protein
LISAAISIREREKGQRQLAHRPPDAARGRSGEGTAA